MPRSTRRHRLLGTPGLASMLLCLSLLGAGVAEGQPTTVSPGGLRGGSTASSRCPSFSWGAVQGAHAYELVVYEIAVDGPRLAHRVAIPGAAQSWTPDLDRCLEPGGRYAWAVSATGGEDDGWSELSLFEVSPAPSAADLISALEIVAAYAGNGSVLPAGVSGTAPDAAAAAEPVFGAGPPPERVALLAEQPATDVVTWGAYGSSAGPDPSSSGAAGESTAGSGVVHGAIGRVASAAGVAALFENTGAGDVLQGWNGGTEVFSVSGAGTVTAPFFVGSAAQLTNVGDLDCTACLSSGDLAPGQIGLGGLSFPFASEIAVGAVTAAHLAANAVTATHVAPDAVGASHIATGAVGNSELAADSVRKEHLSGAPPSLYRVTNNWCPVSSPGGLTFASNCETDQCQSTPNDLWYTCDGFCSAHSQRHCANTRVGYLLDPS